MLRATTMLSTSTSCTATNLLLYHGLVDVQKRSRYGGMLHLQSALDRHLRMVFTLGKPSGGHTFKSLYFLAVSGD